ncbi:MAG: ribonuclease J [Actinomycetota bacterium]|nr:ribonuclease J [Actinomycetota bacterium]
MTITFLGGLGEIGRNCAAIELEGRIMLLDCGLMFPDADMLGVDLVLPDFTYLRANRDRIEGCIVTHGHEDHAGGLSYLLRDCSFPIIGSALTLGLARSRIEEAGLLDRTDFIAVRDGERRTFGPFDCEFIPVAHSVPDGFATAFHTPQGTILHTGDFKIDLNPVDGRTTDLATMGAIARDEGIRLLLADSTNADQHGHSRSETAVGKVLRDVFAAQRGRRIITACFASHIHRIQQIADAAIAEGRVVATLGLSMKRVVALALELKALDIPRNKLVDINDVGDLPPGEVCVISTGSQGEPMSALARMAVNESKWLTLTADDTVVLSSHPIPGNEMNVTKVIDSLFRIGADVVHSGVDDVHTTGHAKQEELKTILSITKPEWFTPVHGEYHHLVSHARLAKQMGVAEDHINVCEDGDQLIVTDKGVRKGDGVRSGYLYVDGAGVGDVGHAVLRDRQVLAEDGIVVIFVTVDARARDIVTGPEITSRGWISERDTGPLIDACRGAVADALEHATSKGGAIDIEALQAVIRRTAGRFVKQHTKRYPMIVPVVVEI